MRAPVPAVGSRTQGAAEQFGAFAQTGESAAARGQRRPGVTGIGGIGAERVPDAQTQPAVLARQGEVHGSRRPVPVRIAEQLGDAAQQLGALELRETLRQDDPGAQVHARGAVRSQQLLESGGRSRSPVGERCRAPSRGTVPAARASVGHGGGPLLLAQQGEHVVELAGRVPCRGLDRLERLGDGVRIPMPQSPGRRGLHADDRQRVPDAVVQLAGDARALRLPGDALLRELEPVMRGRPQHARREPCEQHPRRPPQQGGDGPDQHSENDGGRAAGGAGGHRHPRAQGTARQVLDDHEHRGGQEGQQQHRDQQPGRQVQDHPGAARQVVRETRASGDEQVPVGPEHGAGSGHLELAHPGDEAERRTEEQADRHQEHGAGRSAVRPVPRQQHGAHHHQQDHREADGGTRHQPREAAALPSNALHRSILLDHAPAAPATSEAAPSEEASSVREPSSLRERRCPT